MAQKDPSSIRKIDVTPNSPVIVLCNDEQLDDVKRFCAPAKEKQSILSRSGFIPCSDRDDFLTYLKTLKVLVHTCPILLIQFSKDTFF